MTDHLLRVAYVDHCGQASGAELALLRLLPHLNGIAPLVVLGEDGPLVPLLQSEGIVVQVLPLAARTRSLPRGRVASGRLPVAALWDITSYTLRLAWLLRRQRVQIVHTNSNKAHLYGGVAARLAGVPHVWHARDRVAQEFMPAAAVSLTRLAARRLPKTVLVNSFSTLATLPRAAKVSGVDPVLRDPVDPRSLVEVLDRRLPVRRVLMLGRLTPWKGQDVFLRAFAEAFGSTGDVRAVLQGDALFGEIDYVESLHRLAKELGIDALVDFAGHTNDVPGVLSRVDVMVHASVIPEPFGQVIVEGMAAGLPVVAADAGGPAEILSHDVTGLLVPPGDVAALAAALRRLAAEPETRQRLAVAARERAVDYLPGPLARQLEDTYARVLAERSGT